MQPERIEPLDWLRGLMALSIMIFHMIVWNFFDLDASSFLGRLSMYGVSIFFIISGLCMSIVYNNYIKNLKTSFNFFVRRIFRIWPLLWVVTFLLVVRSHNYTLGTVVLTITTLFGFLNTAAIGIVTWSIGNEMVFYLLTPLIIPLFNHKKWMGNIVFLFTVAIGIFFSFFILRPSILIGGNLYFMLEDQWSAYSDPFNNLFLFVAGVAMYYNLSELKISRKKNIALLFLSVLMFSFLPFSGDKIALVTGFGRVIFSVLAFLIVFCFYKLDINLPHFYEKILTGLGLASYGIYLLHPVIFTYLKYIFNKLSADAPLLLFFAVPAITIFISYYAYKYFELKFIKIGKKLTA